MVAIRFFGWLLIGVGVAALGLGVWLWLGKQDLTLAAGQLWFNIDSASLNTTQAAVQRYLHPSVWDVVFVPLLLRQAWEAIAIVVFGFLIAGGLLQLAPRRKSRRKLTH